MKGKTARQRFYLVYLDWPERCFRAGAREIALLKSMAPAGSSVVRVTGDRAFLRRLPEATHVITWHFRAEWFSLARRLEVLATPGAGRELVAWRDAPPGVKVHFGGFHGKIMSETVAGFVLAWARGFFRREVASARAGATPWRDAWPRAAIGGVCRTVAATKAVVAGYGRIGRAIGDRLAALGIEVAGVTRRNVSELPALARDADWFVMALPSDTGTDDFLDARLIARLPRRCVVVNVGRGNAVDEAALLDALRGNRIAGAYLDVFKGESRIGEGDAGAEILAADPRSLPWNLVMMPHSSAFSSDYLTMCLEELKHEGLV